MGGFVPPFASSETEQETHLPQRESSWSTLRLKFISGNKKDFISAAKSGRSIVYPDSFSDALEQCPSKVVHSTASLIPSLPSSSSPLTSSLSSLSSSSSPPYLSLDSFSSDASFNSTSFTDSPVESPSAAFCFGLTSSVFSNFSNMALQSSKISPHSISKSSKFIDVNFSSESCLKSSPSKKCPLSIAERRGSMSKCLKLQMLTDNSQGRDAPPCCLLNHQDLMSRKDDTCSLDKLCETENLLHPKEQGLKDHEWSHHVSLDRVDSCHVEAALRSDPDLVAENCHVEEMKAATVNGVVDNGVASDEFIQPIVCRLPSLEKILTFSSDDLESQSSFVFILPSSYSGKLGAGVLYFWVGRLFNCNKWKIQCETNQQFDDLVEVDWKKASLDVVCQLGLPKDIKIEIIMEDEEPAEFLSFLSSL